MCTSSFNLKLLYFIWFGGASFLLPYLTLHCKILGIPIKQATLITGILPLLQIATLPFSQWILRTSSLIKKPVLWTLLFAAISAILLLLSPLVPAPVEKEVSMHLHCGPNIKPAVIVNKCNYLCENDPFLRNGREVFFAECHVDCPNKKGAFKNTADLCFDNYHNRFCHVVEVNNTLSENFTFILDLGDGQNQDIDECLYLISGVTWHQSYFHHVTCPIILKESTSSCALTCELQESTTNAYFLSGPQKCLKESPSEISSIIWSYFGLRVIFQLLLSLSSAVVESVLSFTTKQMQIDRKINTFISLLASGMTTPFAGLLMENYSSDVVTNFKIVILVYFCFIIASIALMSSIQVQAIKIPAIEIRKTLKLLKEIEVCTFLFIVFIVGVIAGFPDTFLFWYFDDISCPYYIMGLTNSIGLLVGLPLLLKQCSLIFKKCDARNVLYICITLQGIRCLLYYTVSSYWWSLPLELMGAIIYNFQWKAILLYSRIHIPSEYQHVFQAYEGILHCGLGRSIGAFAGGSLVSFAGFKMTFLVFGSSSVLLAAVCSILHHLLRRRLRKLKLVDEGSSLESDQEEKDIPCVLNSSSHLIATSTDDPSLDDSTSGEQFAS